MPDLPTGTVTFLFTDIEGSTRLWEQHPEAMTAVLARHDAILSESCPHLRILASGREALGIVGEQTYRVPSLSVPDPQRLPPLE
jgi:class 3 adenylate cyclase